MNTFFLFPEMLIQFIKNSKIEIPSDLNNIDFVEYPHYSVFMCLHLGKVIDPGYLRSNANIIADYPKDKFVGEDDIQKFLDYLDTAGFYLPSTDSPIV